MKRFNPCAAPTETAAVIFSPPPEPTEQQIQQGRDRQREYAELQTRRETLFIKHYGQPDAPKVSVPFGMMVVHLSVKFDNSDSQTDYFDRHASLSPDFVLLVVKKQAETERLARKALALCPELARLDWEWHSEKYSMGHGNYLESSGFELPDELKNLQVGYRSGGVTHGHWEIEFSRPYNDGQVLQIPPHHNHGQTPTVRPIQSSSEIVTLTENKSKNGLELRFPHIPAEAVRAELKAAGWRWSRFGWCWYIRDTETSRAFVAGFIDRFVSPTSPTPSELPVPPTPVIAPITILPTWRQRFLTHP